MLFDTLSIIYGDLPSVVFCQAGASVEPSLASGWLHPSYQFITALAKYKDKHSHAHTHTHAHTPMVYVETRSVPVLHSLAPVWGGSPEGTNANLNCEPQLSGLDV